MKRVSFEVARAIKEAGYPQENCGEYYNKYGTIDAYLGHNIARPYILDVWLWLWREKDIRIQNNTYDTIICLVESKPNRIIYLNGNAYGKDPEEVIKQAIEYLVTNNLIK